MVLSSPREGLSFGGLSQGFEMRGMRPDRGMGLLAGEPQHLNLLGYIWTAIGLLLKHLRLLGYRGAGSSLATSCRHGTTWGRGIGSWWDHLQWDVWVKEHLVKKIINTYPMTVASRGKKNETEMCSDCTEEARMNEPDERVNTPLTLERWYQHDIPGARGNCMPNQGMMCSRSTGAAVPAVPWSWEYIYPVKVLIRVKR